MLILSIFANIDYLLLSFAILLGASFGFLLRHALINDVAPPPPVQNIHDENQIQIFNNSHMVSILWPEDDDGQLNNNFNIYGDNLAKEQVFSVLNCTKDELLSKLIEGDENLGFAITRLRQNGSEFQTHSKGMEIFGLTFGANACVLLRVANPAYGARGTTNIPTPIWKNDNKGNLSWGNDAFLKAVEAKNLEDAIESQVHFDAKSKIEAKAALKGKASEDTRAVSVGGQRRMMRVLTAPAFDGSIAIAFDINEEIQVQELLKREAKAHVETLNGLNDAVAVFDSARRLQTYNSAFAALWSLENSWLDDHPTNEEILDKLRSKSWLPHQRNYQNWRNEQIEYFKATSNIPDETWTLRDGRILRVMRQRQPIGGLLILFEDISDKTSLQAQFKTQIEVSRATLDKLQEGVAVFASDGRLSLANHAFAEIWNLDKDFINSYPEFSEVSRLASNLYPDDEFWHEIHARIGDPTPSGRQESNGLINLRNQIILQYLTRPLPDGATMIAFHDVTAQNRMESVLRDKALALAEADKLKTAFLEKVSYQLRTPLTTISGYSDILLTGIGGELSPLQHDYLNSVHQAAEQLEKMVGDLLDLAVIDAGHAPLDLGDVNINDVLEQTREIAQSKLSHSQMNIIVEGDNIGLIRADDKKIRQIMFNLVNNSMRGLEAGDAIKIGAKRHDDTIKLYVSAPNHNIDFLNAPLEFEAFTEGSKRGGLGLVLVKKFVELHGGWLAMGSKDKGILTITCHLPVNAKPNEVNPELELV